MATRKKQQESYYSELYNCSTCRHKESWMCKQLEEDSGACKFYSQDKEQHIDTKTSKSKNKT